MSDELMERAVRAQEKCAADYAEALRHRKADRRERIATAALQGLLTCPSDPTFVGYKGWAVLAIGCADALIAELDKDGAP